MDAYHAGNLVRALDRLSLAEERKATAQEKIAAALADIAKSMNRESD